MLGTQDIGAHGKVLPQWGLLLNHRGWLIFIDNWFGFRLICVWLERHFPTDLNEEGRSTLNVSGSIMEAEGPDWIEGRKEKTRWTYEHFCSRLPGLLRYKWVFVSFSHRCGHCKLSSAVTDSTLKHEPKPVCPEVVSYRVFGKKKQWQKPLIFSIILCPYSKGPIGISVSSEYLGKAHSYWTCPCVWCCVCTEPTPLSCIEK